jgi:XTP/dITP diphosphohydrolase
MLIRNQIIVIATRNTGKLAEFRTLFAPYEIEVKGLSDFDSMPDIIEDELTFAGNAYKKAKVIAQQLHMPVLADDSGLCVDALHGAPGIWSARYAGVGATDEQNIQKLMHTLAEHLKVHPLLQQNSTIDPAIRLLSAARFECALCLVDEQAQQQIAVQGSCDGWITDQPIGTQGFGYDPIFYIPSLGKTMAQISLQEKNRISHRAVAMQHFMKAYKNK